MPFIILKTFDFLTAEVGGGEEHPADDAGDTRPSIILKTSDCFVANACGGGVGEEGDRRPFIALIVHRGD